MRRLFARQTPAVAAVLLAVTACGGAGTGVPGASSAAQGMPGGDDRAAARANYSGQYSGTFHDSIYKTGKATESLAQSGSALGGTLSIKFGHAPVSESVGLTVNGTSAKGTSVIELTDGYCAFSASSTYDSKTNEVSGTYKAIHGCTGETGQYKLAHQCTYVEGADEEIRPQNGPKPC